MPVHETRETGSRQGVSCHRDIHTSRVHGSLDREYAVLTAMSDGSGFPDGLVLYSMAWGFTAGRTGRLAFLCCTRAGSRRSCVSHDGRPMSLNPVVPRAVPVPGQARAVLQAGARLPRLLSGRQCVAGWVGEGIVPCRGVYCLEGYMGSDSAGGARVRVPGVRADVCGAGRDARAAGVGCTGLIRIGKRAVLRGNRAPTLAAIGTVNT